MLVISIHMKLVSSQMPVTPVVQLLQVMLKGIQAVLQSPRNDTLHITKYQTLSTALEVKPQPDMCTVVLIILLLFQLPSKHKQRKAMLQNTNRGTNILIILWELEYIMLFSSATLLVQGISIAICIIVAAPCRECTKSNINAKQDIQGIQSSKASLAWQGKKGC